MQRLTYDETDTFVTWLVASCLVVGIAAAVFSLLGPAGWLAVLFKDLLADPNMRALVALLGIMGVLAICRRWLERNPRTLFNNLVVGTVGLGGFIVLLQGLRTFVH